MPSLDYDTLSLIASHGSIADLRSMASVCRSWRSATVPKLFHNICIHFETEQEEQLEGFKSSLLNPDWSCRLFVRELRIEGNNNRFLTPYVNLLVKSLPAFENLNHFIWQFGDNIPEHLFNALNHHPALQCLTVGVFPRRNASKNSLDYLGKSSKIFNLVVDSRFFSSHPLQVWSSQMPSVWNKRFQRNFHVEITSRGATKSSVRQDGYTNQHHHVIPRLESLTLDGCSIRLWQTQHLSDILDLQNLKQLSLVYCDNPMLLDWQRYPQELEVLQIIDPFPTYPIKAGLLIREGILRRALSQFRRLTELSLQNVGAPVCEVLFHLVDSGKSLKVLRLHDQEISGIDRLYTFWRNQPQLDSGSLDCDFAKILTHICPNVETLSLDISHDGLEYDRTPEITRHLGSDSLSAPLEPLMEEVAEIPTTSLSENFHNLTSLRHLRLVTPRIGNAWGNETVERVSRRMWSSSLEIFTLVASYSPAALNENQNQGEQTIEHLGDLEWCVKSRLRKDTAGVNHEELYFAES